MDAVAALSARAAPGGIYFGHRRLLVSRHHARRRDADHRDGGDERLPQGTARQDPRPQRPPAGAAARDAAHRLAGGGRAARRRSPGIRLAAPIVEGPGARLVAVQRRRRAGARHPRPGPRRGSPRSPTTSSRARWKASTRGRAVVDRPASRRPALAARRRQHHAGRAARRGDADGHDAAHQGLQGRRRVRDRHVGIRRRLRVHAARRGAGLFQPHRRRHRDRGLHQQSRRVDALPPARHRGRASGRSS